MSCSYFFSSFCIVLMLVSLHEATQALCYSALLNTTAPSLTQHRPA